MAELSSQPLSIQSVYGLHSEEKLYVNRRYQRKLVWTLLEKQKLVESIIKRYPVPAILLAEKDGNASYYEIIDGLQRLNAIISFIEGGFPTIDGKYFDISKFPTANENRLAGSFVPVTQDNLIDSKEVSVILDYSMAFSIMRDATEHEVNDVFDRINSYGHRLSDQERRQSGIQNEFSDMVRTIACNIRGDQSLTHLALSKMPEISIDLPMTKHGYDVKADQVFWVQQGILKSTDLRDSLDEQCVADIAASIISGSVLERSKDVLDKIYESDSPESRQLLSSLAVYGQEKFTDEFEYCIQQVEMLCNDGDSSKLRDIIYEHRNTNAFPAVFSLILIAMHEVIVGEKKTVNSYSGLKDACTNLTRRIDTSRKSTAANERRLNINTIKALISPHFSDNDPSKDIYSNHSVIDIDNHIRATGMELSRYELKQGILGLHGDRNVNEDLLDKLVYTACGIANIGPDREGRIIIGVADDDEDARRIFDLDGVTAKKVGSWNVVGVNREARKLGITLEGYYSLIQDKFRNSNLSAHLKESILTSIDYNSYYGLGVMIITIPSQKQPSYVDDDMYWRDSDKTKKADGAKQIANIVQRF